MISNKANKEMIHAILEDFTKNSLDQIKDSLQNLINELMIAEREDFNGAGPYQRSPDRKHHSNGFKDKKLLTRYGELELNVPQVRDGDFYPSCLEKGQRIEQALALALAEAYVQGVSTRKSKKITEQLCGKEISSDQISRLSKVLDEEVKKFKNRNLGKYRYLYLDAQYEKVRNDGCVKSLSVLKAVGIKEDGCREILDFSCSLSEAEPHWRKFLEGLVSRGLNGLELIISDAHVGLIAARQSVFPSVKWQRCLFHLAQNAGAYSPTVAMRKEISSSVREIYNSIDKDEAKARMQKVVDRYKDKASDFCNWLEENFEEGLTFFDFPKSHWKKIRTNNLVERLNQEQKRRTRVARLFPTVESCERLIGMIAIRKHEEWVTGKKYLTMEN